MSWLKPWLMGHVWAPSSPLAKPCRLMAPKALGNNCNIHCLKVALACAPSISPIMTPLYPQLPSPAATHNNVSAQTTASSKCMHVDWTVQAAVKTLRWVTQAQGWPYHKQMLMLSTVKQNGNISWDIPFGSVDKNTCVHQIRPETHCRADNKTREAYRQCACSFLSDAARSPTPTGCRTPSSWIVVPHQSLSRWASMGTPGCPWVPGP